MRHITGVMIYKKDDFIALYPDKLIATHNNKQIQDTFTDVAWQYDTVIYVPRGVKVTAPIQLQTIVDYTSSQLCENYEGQVDTERIAIVVEENAQVTIHDISSACRSTNQVTRLIEVILHDYAQVTFIMHQDQSISVNEQSRFYFYLGNYSSVHYTSFLTGGHTSTSRLEVIMEGEHAHADLSGVWLLDGVRTIDMTTMQQHSGAHNTSRLRIKSAVRDHARSVYRGTVHIAVDARGTHAAQENKNILLSEHASASSIPNLEALNNEVYCAHGTAVGQLDEEQLLYMQARGIDYKQAQRMLLQGFLADAIPQFLDDEMRAMYMARIAQWLDV